MISMLHILETDLDDDLDPVDGSWEFVGLVKWAMEILSTEGPGFFYCERDGTYLIVCLDGALGPCITVQ
jgi:hypothetical protein